MRRIILGVCSALFLLPAVSLAAAPTGRVHVNLVNAGIDDGSFDDDGTGFGVGGWAMVAPNFFLHGEYQSVETDDYEIDLDSFRAGAGWASAPSGGMVWLVYGEFIDFGSDIDEDGFGVHGGLVLGAEDALSFNGAVGYLITDNTDGIELEVGAHYAFTPQIGGAVGYRIYMGSVDPSGDIDLSQLTIGGTFSFGG